MFISKSVVNSLPICELKRTKYCITSKIRLFQVEIDEYILGTVVVEEDDSGKPSESKPCWRVWLSAIIIFLSQCTSFHACFIHASSDFYTSLESEVNYAKHRRKNSNVFSLACLTDTEVVVVFTFMYVLRVHNIQWLVLDGYSNLQVKAGRLCQSHFVFTLCRSYTLQSPTSMFKQEPNYSLTMCPSSYCRVFFSRHYQTLLGPSNIA